jgi:hypothetical protein
MGLQSNGKLTLLYQGIQLERLNIFPVIIILTLNLSAEMNFQVAAGSIHNICTMYIIGLDRYIG